MAGRTCEVEGCGRKHHAKGFCKAHYHNKRRGVVTTIDSTISESIQVENRCSVPDCRDSIKARGYCLFHYDRVVKFGEPSPDWIRKMPRKGAISTCQYDGCDRRLSAKGLCDAHYRQKRDGRPLTPLPPLRRRAKSLAEYMSWYSERRGDCLVWVGRKTESGYGIVSYQTRVPLRAHRIAYEMSTGLTLSSATPVHHKCGNPLCVEPRHLQATFPHENTAEMLERAYYKKRIAELEAQLAELTQAA